MHRTNCLQRYLQNALLQHRDDTPEQVHILDFSRPGVRSTEMTHLNMHFKEDTNFEYCFTRFINGGNTGGMFTDIVALTANDFACFFLSQ